MQLITVKGIVVRSVDYAERDRILTLYTDELGLITATANGSRSLRSRSLVATELFCYSQYVLSYNKDRYSVKEVDLIESFFDLRTDIEKLSLAGYVGEVVAHVGTENMPDVPLLRLTLNTLYAIAKEKAPRALIKGAFEMRAASVLGFSPELAVCSSCGEEGRGVVLDVMNGSVLCERCRREAEDTAEVYDPVHPTIRVLLTDSARTALFYVVRSPIEKLLSFKLEDPEDLDSFAVAAETYLINHLETSFKSLEFYKQLLKGESAVLPTEEKRK